jgi:UDP-N-acetylglucosamine 3-dehydrogenase
MKIALVGLGSMGRHHYNVINNIKSIELVAVVEQDESKAIDITVPVYCDIDDMLDDTLPDIVVVATPTSTHIDISKKVLTRGINLLVEKPIAKNAAEAKQMMILAERNDCKAVVGHVERYNPAIQTALPRLREEKVIHCTITRMSSYPKRITDVGVKLDLGIHDIDLIRLITQSNIQTCKNLDSTNIGDKEDSAAFMLKMFDGTIATITASWLTPFRERKFKIITEKSYYEIDLLDLSVNIYTITGDNGYMRESLKVKTGNALQNQLLAFVNYIKTGDYGTLCRLEDGLLALSYAEEED